MLNKHLCVFGAVIALLLEGCATQPPLTQEQRTNPALYGEKPTPEYVEAIVMRVFNNMLKDPDSARYAFNHAFTRRVVSWDDETHRYRFGYLVEFGVNGKNSYGGYTGLEPYRMILEQGKNPLAYTEPYDMGTTWRTPDVLDGAWWRRFRY